MIALPAVIVLGGVAAAGFAYAEGSWREGLQLFRLFALLDGVIIFGSLGMRALARRRGGARPG